MTNRKSRLRQGVLPFLLALLCFLGASGPAAAEEEKPTVQYFYENYCETCDPEAEFAATFRALTGLALENFSLEAYNVVQEAGREALEKARNEIGLDRAALPLVIVNGTAYCGEQEIQRRLPEDALTWEGQEEKDSVLVYVYVPACESCARAESALDALPESVTVRRGEVTFESAVRIVRLDASADPAAVDALFTAYAVPDGQRVTPIVFFADRYLSGAEAIASRLLPAVRAGSAVGGVKAAAEGAAEEKALSLWGTVGAGLAAGLNTCALSMLLMFLSVVMGLRRHAAALAAEFLAVKFLCYLLIGFALTEVMQRFNPIWLQPLARWLLTAIGVALAALTLRDAWQLRRGNLGEVRNQLPAPLRGALHRAIRRLTNSRLLFAGTAAIAVVVAFGEFLCAGQLYLMRLLSAVHAGSRAQAVNLTMYCLSFIAPSALLSAAVIRAKSDGRLAALLADHMTAVKVVTAVAMLGVVAFAWLGV